MDKKNREYILQIISSMNAVVSIFITVYLLINNENEVGKTDIMLILLFTIMLINVAFIFLQRLRLNRRTTEIQRLDRLIDYNKKRKELDEKINLLTRELMHSSLSEYLDINRLVFEGQNEIINNRNVNYNTFFEQFGLSNKKKEIRKNSAIFLTAFNEEGKRLFNECKRILDSIDIFLQKTDNYVEEDIMMNTVSLIVQSEIVIVNINGRNPNVYYELGIAHAIGKPTILLSKSDFDLNDIGFNIRQKRMVMYNSLNDLEIQLLYQVNRLIIDEVFWEKKVNIKI